jgi:signal peptidase II
MKPRHLALAGALFALDQASKWVAQQALSTPVPLLGSWLKLALRTNTGAGFSLFQGNNAALALASIVIISLLLVFFGRFSDREKWFAAAVMGGALGNLIDRLTLGYVVDFIELSFWPTFNVADAGITIGALGLVLLSFRKS